LVFLVIKFYKKEEFKKLKDKLLQDNKEGKLY